MIAGVNTTGLLINWSNVIIDTNLSNGGNINNNVHIIDGFLNISNYETNSSKSLIINTFNVPNNPNNGLIELRGHGNYGYLKFDFKPEYDFDQTTKVLMQVHNKNFLDNSTHKHFSIYTTNSTNSLTKRLDLQYDVDSSNLDIRNTDLRIISGISDLWIGKTKLTDFKTDGGNSTLRLYPDVTGNNHAIIEMFRLTNTTGSREIQINKGDGSNTDTVTINVATGDITMEGNLTSHGIDVNITRYQGGSCIWNNGTYLRLEGSCTR